ncbi:galectin-12 isoform X6 [Canis aureus]
MSPGEKLDPLPDIFILQPPVFHPVVPYVTTIFGGLRAGKMVMLQGMVPEDAHRFQVDFQCGCSLHPRPDIAIHFNPRFHTTKPHVICNTLQHGRWQAEARWPHLTLQRGASFLILFLFGNEEMKVSVNGQHFLHYHYRLPLSRVDTLGIFGNILVEAIGFLNINPFAEGGIEYPIGYPFLLKSSSLKVPCSCALPRGLWPGQVIVLRALVLSEPKDFETWSYLDVEEHYGPARTFLQITPTRSHQHQDLAQCLAFSKPTINAVTIVFWKQLWLEMGKGSRNWRAWNSPLSGVSS